MKFAQNQHGDGKAIFTEQIVAGLGRLLGAPVADVALVQLPEALVDELNANREAHGIDYTAVAGVHHGSRWVEGYGQRAELAHVDTNRESFGALDVLYTWAPYTGDYQWIYADAAPHAVMSVDHTPFFPGGPAWSEETLAADEATVVANEKLATIGLANADRRAAVHRLRGITERQIAYVVARPPRAWGVSASERLALARYLWLRKDRVIALFS